MAIHLQKELEQLKQNLLQLSSKVVQSVENSVDSLKNNDSNLAKEVIDNDHQIDLQEINVEEECLKILALHQPVAIDLRFVIASLKINNDLERVADLSVNIAERSIYLNRKSPIPAPFDLNTMSEKTQLMLKKALEAFVKMDVKMAEEVGKEDQEIDDIHRQMYKAVYSAIKENPNHVKLLIHYLSISKHLERIADYATNIAEDVIYMIKGTIIRHQPDDYSWENE